MMQQTIKLIFKKDLTKLAGNAFGKNTYETQVKDVIDFNASIVFEIPTQIDRIASSFVQGFFDAIVKEIGVQGIEQQISYISSITDLKEFVLDNLE